MLLFLFKHKTKINHNPSVYATDPFERERERERDTDSARIFLLLFL